MVLIFISKVAKVGFYWKITDFLLFVIKYNDRFYFNEFILIRTFYDQKHSRSQPFFLLFGLISPLSVSPSLPFQFFPFSPHLSPPSSSGVCSFWMSRFYERSDKEKGGWRAEREGEVEDRGGCRGEKRRERERERWGQKKWEQERARPLLLLTGFCQGTFFIA